MNMRVVRLTSHKNFMMKNYIANKANNMKQA